MGENGQLEGRADFGCDVTRDNLNKGMDLMRNKQIVTFWGHRQFFPKKNFPWPLKNTQLNKSNFLVNFTN